MVLCAMLALVFAACCDAALFGLIKSKNKSQSAARQSLVIFPFDKDPGHRQVPPVRPEEQTVSIRRNRRGPGPEDLDPRRRLGRKRVLGKVDDLGADLGEKKRFLQGRRQVTDDRRPAPPVEEPVTGGAIADPPAQELFFAGDGRRLGRAGGQDHASCRRIGILAAEGPV